MGDEEERIAVVGGGAAGFFAALSSAEHNPTRKIDIFEKHKQVLAKVRISGGGRCNVTQGCFDPALLVRGYPRGYRELRGPFSRFQPQDTIEWFAARGVMLKQEADGRIFPVSDSSQTIIDCFLKQVERLGISLFSQREVQALEKGKEKGFWLHFSSGEPRYYRRVLLATGSARSGYEWASQLGHSIIEPVPSLFTFTIQEKWLTELAGVTLEPVEIHIKGTGLTERGAVLITHWGLSGPAVLKLSAWGARLLHKSHYQASLVINWVFPKKTEEVKNLLQVLRRESPHKTIGTENLFHLPKNLWKKLLEEGCFAHLSEKKCAHLSNQDIQRLACALTAGEFTVIGKSTYKEEFVTCGGVALEEVNMQTMESRLCAGLYFAGEILDIDGITGGFNFQNAWTTGWLAGRALAEEILV